MATIPELFAAAVAQHRTGDRQRAKDLYTQIVTADPEHAEAWHFLGMLAYQSGQHESARELMGKSVVLNGARAAFHSNLGAVCMALGRLSEAVACYHQALSLCPDLADAHNNLANALREQGNRTEAVQHYRHALRLQPAYAEALNNLGTLLKEEDALDEAARCYRQALSSKPDYPSAHTNLGAVLMEQGRLDEALACHQRALQLQPGFAEAHYHLANTLFAQGKAPEAIASYHEALRLKPHFAEAYNDLGNAWKAQGNLPEALASFRRALEIKPTYPEAHCNLGNTHLDQGRLAEARTHYQAALRLRPGFALAHTNLLFCLNHDPSVDLDALFTEHCRWGRLHSQISPPPSAHGNDPDPHRRLRIGYVSPDFRKHPVARFFEPILANHDPNHVEVYCYAQVPLADEVTARLQALAHGWRSTVGLSDLQVANLIRHDGIDILVDLAGHTANHRLKVFAHKPAPVQVTYLGYPNTTGLTSIDYRLTDAVLDPLPFPSLLMGEGQGGGGELSRTAPPPQPSPTRGEGAESETRYTEELVRLADGFFCFAPPRDAPAVGPLPTASTGRLTFGSTHRLEKLNADVLDLWCRVLHAVPSARMLVFWSLLTEPTKEALRQQFAERGIHGDRLEIRHQLARAENQPSDESHLKIYREIDIVLDVFPWTGHATTCESLWMGVPLVTLTGARPAARLTASVLTCMGLTELIAQTPDEYVRLAQQLANDRARLAELRGTLRERMQVKVCDGRRFTRGLEEAYRGMWRKWCAQRAPRAELEADTWHQRGLHAYEQHDYASAIAALQKAVACAPDRADFYSNLAEIHRSAGQLAEAETSARQALRLNPALAEAHHNLALALAEQGQLDEAVVGFRQALQLNPSDAEIFNNLGNALQRQGTPEARQEAARCYEQALRLRPGFALAHTNLGNLRREQGRLEEAEASYRQALHWQPDLVSAHSNLGAVLQEQGRPAEAEACFREALRHQPDFALAQGNLGNVLKELGKLDEALACYREALRLQPQSAQAHYNLGNALLEHDERDEAQASYREALRLQPDFAEAHCNLGSALMNQGKLEEAVASFREALRLKPDLADAHHGLGVALMQQGKLDEAAASHRQALRLQPDCADAHNGLGNVLRQQGKVDEAVLCYREALRHQPAYAEARYRLGNTLLEQGKYEEAAARFQEVLRLQPDCVLAHNNLGVAFMEQGLLREAADCYRTALRLDPNHALSHNNLGVALMEQGQREEALAHYQEAIRLNPDYAEAHSNLGNSLKAEGKLAEAVVSNQQALRLNPHFAEAHNNMGVAYLEQGKRAEAEACYREALRLKPDYAAAHSNLLFCLNYDPHAEPMRVHAEHRRWGELHGKTVAPLPPHTNDPAPERRLKIGYVSPDFRNHAVAHFFEPILAHHDPVQLETVCYAEVMAPDATTAHLQSLAHRWRSTVGLTDAEMAEMIRRDGIDILVDLAGHTAHQRLRAFAYRPAPVQVTYLGYPNTTGLTCIDYRLTDAVLDPPDVETRYTEELVRLAAGFCCFAPPRAAPEITPLPALRTGRVTFGSLHNLAKLNAEVITLWCQVLRAVPSGRLLLYRNTLSGETREFIRRQFTERGIPDARLELRSTPPSPPSEGGVLAPSSEGGVRGGSIGHLATYTDIDLSLDVFPWTGHVISCEALWMGVPVLTLRGKSAAARLTASVLSRLELTELIADTPEQYVALASALAGDLDGLARLRFGLRARMQTRLCDGQAFTRVLEEAYRSLWRRWCARQVGSGTTGSAMR